MRGRVSHLHRSEAGMPKEPADRLELRASGVIGDRQRDLVHHGGPERAVCLLGLEVIEAIAAEGHPIRPGSTGENVTIAGLDWAKLRPGMRLELDGGVILELTSFAAPCRTIQGSFSDRRFGRLGEKQHPGSSRLYARVLVEGAIALGEGLTARSGA